MASIPELHVFSHWKYRAEGNANLVLQYVGPDPRFSSIILRLRKADRVLQPDLAREDTRLHAQSESAVKDLGKELAYQSKVMALLLGDEFVEHPPKWGYLPAAHFLPESAAIKRRKCRFCMYQYLKALEAKEQELSGYCPIDLFSAQEGHVHHALDSLVKTPQNNLRLFVDGEQQPVTEESMERAFTAPSLPGGRDDATTSTTGATLNALLTEILIRSPLLTRLSRLQQGLDYLDIEVIHRFYTSLVARRSQRPPGSAEADTPKDETEASSSSSKKKKSALGLPEPTVDEYLNAAEAFLERSMLNTLSEQRVSQEEFEERLETSVGFGPEDDLEEDVPDAIKEHYLREFLLAATLKDCSLIVTMERIVSSPPQEQPLQPHDPPKQQESKQHELHEREHRIKVGGCEYRYKMVCIDLDPKKINAIPRYLDKDRQTVSHYLHVVGDREEACGSH
ncbi:Inositol-pentakisphosphate 2-kinase [Actinomortierella ambigua]|nr:Inositol-pentakisphosphate 2-kinase [Actinomortierella ambigua]